MKEYSADQIILMTRLAKYDKHHRENDAKILQYYRHDYIYKQNMKTRISVLLGMAILLGIYAVVGITNDSIDMGEILSGAFNFKILLFKLLFYGVIVLLLYTFVSTVQSTHTYQQAQQRMFFYLQTMDLLEERRRLHNLTIDEWDDRELAHTRVVKREVPYE